MGFGHENVCERLPCSDQKPYRTRQFFVHVPLDSQEFFNGTRASSTSFVLFAPALWDKLNQKEQEDAQQQSHVTLFIFDYAHEAARVSEADIEAWPGRSPIWLDDEAGTERSDV